MDKHYRKVRIADAIYDIAGDAGYLNRMGLTFEPATVDALAAIVVEDSQVIDVGANIGFTSIALSALCPRGKIAAVEPLPRAFALLEENLSTADARNVSTFNIALGKERCELNMQGNHDFLAGSFIADKFSVPYADHFSEVVPVHPLDDVFPTMGLSGLDAMKVDVEGFELDVFEGAQSTLSTYKPLVFMEMNHWCLSMFRRITLPEFRERLLAIFPFAYAIHGNEVVDLGNDIAFHHVAHGHLTQGKFGNLIVGFDSIRINSAINRYQQLRS